MNIFAQSAASSGMTISTGHDALIVSQMKTSLCM